MEELNGELLVFSGEKSIGEKNAKVMERICFLTHQACPNWLQTDPEAPIYSFHHPPIPQHSTGCVKMSPFNPTQKSISSSSRTTSPYSAAPTLQPNYPSHLITTFDSGPCKPKKPPIQIPPISFSIFSPTEFPPPKKKD